MKALGPSDIKWQVKSCNWYEWQFLNPRFMVIKPKDSKPPSQNSHLIFSHPGATIFSNLRRKSRQGLFSRNALIMDRVPRNWTDTKAKALENNQKKKKSRTIKNRIQIF